MRWRIRFNATTLTVAKISRRAIASEWREPAQSVERSDDHDVEPEIKVISSADVHGFRGTRDDQMKAKHLRLPEPTAKDFEVLCTLLLA